MATKKPPVPGEAPDLLPQDVIKKISANLEEKKVRLVCPMCGSKVFNVVDGFFSLPLSKNLDGASQMFGERQVFPCAGMVCENCGFTSFHSLGPLGLMDRYAPKEAGANNG